MIWKPAWLPSNPRQRWEEFDNWLYNRTNLYKGDDYFRGTGFQQMSDAEVTQLEEWAQRVYERLIRPWDQEGNQRTNRLGDQEVPTKVKNVILFLTDQQRKDSLGAYGNPIIKTPNLDRIANEGVRFERAYVQNPFCCPSRASILTGLYPRTHGVWHNGIQFNDVGAPTLGDILQAHGYRTGSVGKIHLNAWFGPHPPSGYEESQDYWAKHPEMKDWHGPYCGFQEVELTIGHVHYSTKGGHYSAYLEREFPEGSKLLRRENALLNQGYFETWRNAIPEEHHYNTWIADRTMEMIDRFAGQPFFIHCSFPDPHHPFSACEPYASMYDPNAMPDPLPASLEEMAAMPPIYRAHYMGEPTYYSKEPPFFEKIAGAPLREMTAQMYGMVTHVDRSIGRVLDHLSRRGLLDETLVIFTSDHGELLGDHGHILKGPFYYQSLLNIPLIIRYPGAQPGVNRQLVGHVDLVPTILDCLGLKIPAYLPGYSLAGHLRGEAAHVRDAVLTEFRPFGGPNMKILHTSDGWKYVYYHGEKYGELFNLVQDPQERNNLYGKPAYAEMCRRLNLRLLDELIGTEAAWPTKGEWL